jgi:hypothetical protein
MEQSIDRYLNGDSLDTAAAVAAALAAPSESPVAYPMYRSAGENIVRIGAPQWRALPEETDGLSQHATVVGPTPTTSSSQR